MSNARNISKAESRFVNASGDTMTGGLTIGAATIDSSADGSLLLGAPAVPPRFTQGAFNPTQNRKGPVISGYVMTEAAHVYDDAGNNTGWNFDPNGSGYLYDNVGDTNGAYGTVSVTKNFYNGTSGGTYTVAELTTNNGWNGGWFVIELYTQGYYASGYRRGVIQGGYQASFSGELTNYTHGTHFGSISVSTSGPYADGTTGTASSQVDASYNRHTIQVVGSSYGSMIVKITFPCSFHVVNSTNADGQVRLY